jgi:uncharacterized membrane protein YhhN
MNLTANIETYLFLFVVLCFALSFTYRPSDKKDGYLLKSAMLFTVLADFFILIQFNDEIGVFVFVFAQAFYTLRFWGNKNGTKILISSLPFLLLFEFYVFCAVYAVLLCFNVYGAYRQRGVSLAFVGMSLFLLCDINVMLYNVTGAGVLFYVIWAFYAPSQAVLAVSAKRLHHKLP